MTSDTLFDRPTSVFLSGSDRALLKWVAYALAVRPGRDLFWTDVALRGAVGQDVDPLTSNLLPPDRVSVVFANELERDEPSARLADAAVGGVLRADESPEMLRRIAGFLRLPAHTQELLSRVPSGGPPPIIVLSNAHRMVALYPHDTVAPILRAIVEFGVVLIVTFADAPPQGRLAFDTILSVEGHDPGSWRAARLRAERGRADGPFPTGFDRPLADVPIVADVLRTALGR